MSDLHPGTFVAGLDFVVLGGVLLLDAIDVADIQPGNLWPVALIGLGLAILAIRTVDRER